MSAAVDRYVAVVLLAATTAIAAACGGDDRQPGVVGDDEFVASCIGIDDETFDPPAVLCIGSTDGSVRELSQPMTPAIRPAVSASRDRIALVHDGQLIVVNGDGDVHWSMEGADGIVWMTFHDGDASLVVQRLTDSGGSQIERLSAEGTVTEVLLGEGDFTGDVAPGITLSPDGTQLAYATKLTSGSALRIIDIASRVESTVLRSDEGVGIGAPAWSPDGSAIAVVIGEGLERIDVATGSRTMLAAPGVPIATPTWSPDSDEVLFIDARGAVLIAGVAEPALKAIVDHTEGSDGRRFPALPAWS